jgi:hypothetical protein
MKLPPKARGWLACVTVLPLCASCATVTRGSSEPFGIISIPEGALVRASTGWTCMTPCEVEIARRSAFALDIEKPGYRAARVMVRAAHDDAGRRGLIGNIVFGGLIGAAIDSGSGAAFSHPVNPLVIELVPE